ncbi:hypothetical protein [Quadrisphaera sp. KR29]|uniref:hypothetical protein n=1 Tax=Quadrisphaera sp. KR29 TaxID=3461391 RepID=UPI00404443E9
MVTVVVLGAVGLGVGLGAGALLLGLVALSGRAARAGQELLGADGLPLVGARQAQFGDATAALRAASAHPAQQADDAPAPQGGPPLRLVRPAAGGPDQPRPARAA